MPLNDLKNTYISLHFVSVSVIILTIALIAGVVSTVLIVIFLQLPEYALCMMVVSMALDLEVDCSISTYSTICNSIIFFKNTVINLLKQNTALVLECFYVCSGVDTTKMISPVPFRLLKHWISYITFIFSMSLQLSYNDNCQI